MGERLACTSFQTTDTVLSTGEYLSLFCQSLSLLCILRHVEEGIGSVSLTLLMSLLSFSRLYLTIIIDFGLLLSPAYQV